jgi:hypothetical protein
MPYSYSHYKEDVKKHIFQNIPSDAKILDVGPGSGTYAHLLRERYHIDGLEIFEPYIDRFGLRQFYNNVIVGNILEFDFSGYDYIIMGDILEHIKLEDATKLLENINNHCKCLVAVPYLFEQGEWEGNIHETHHQPDLTPELFLQRYPYMNLLFGDNHYGYYINY